jgi:hypothetical protein
MLQRVLRRNFTFNYQGVFKTTGPLDIPWKKLTSDYVKEVTLGDRTFLEVDPKGIELLSQTAMEDIAHLLRPGHLSQLRKILDDQEASQNDKFVALELLKNANIAAGKILPGNLYKIINYFLYKMVIYFRLSGYWNCHYNGQERSTGVD